MPPRISVDRVAPPPPDHGVSPFEQRTTQRAASQAEQSRPKDPLETSMVHQSFSPEGDMNPVEDMDSDTKQVVFGHFNAFCKEAARLEEMDHEAFNNDPVYKLALKVWRDHPTFFVNTTEEETIPATKEGGEERKVTRFKTERSFQSFKAEELVIIRGVLIKAADQLSAAAGFERTTPNHRMPPDTVLELSNKDVSLEPYQLEPKQSWVKWLFSRRKKDVRIPTRDTEFSDLVQLGY